jgi:hypothetical protein
MVFADKYFFCILQAQCSGREGRDNSYGKRRRRRQTSKDEKHNQDFKLKEMFRVYENREEISGMDKKLKLS